MYKRQIMYHIQLYGACTEELLSALQIQQNKAARSVCKAPLRTKTDTLLQQIGWMNVRQMVVYYSITSIFKTRQTKLPKYVYIYINWFICQVIRFTNDINNKHYCNV